MEERKPLQNYVSVYRAADEETKQLLQEMREIIVGQHNKMEHMKMLLQEENDDRNWRGLRSLLLKILSRNVS
jgi:hypothetical protein